MSSPAPSKPVASPPHHHTTRPLDAMAIAIVMLLCLSWGFNQVAVKLALHDVPPMLQATIRSVVAMILVMAWCAVRRVPLFRRDGTLIAGVVVGLMFGIEFGLIYQGLVYTTASRASVFLYLTPFIVVVGARILMPADRFRPSQWLGLGLSFIGMIVAFGLPTPALDPRQTLGDVMMIVAAFIWAGTTLIIKASRLNGTSPEKVMLYQLVVSAPMMALCAWFAGERIERWPDHQALAWMGYQAVWVVSVTFVIWFALIKKYSASRVSAFTFLTPLFGVAAGHFVLGEPLTPAFLMAVAFVAAGLVLVNRAK
ncbi:MAG TPA: DMT family transporter [Pseudolabrys sp.]|nr:DMT family transporter [Pseudolabrys sp.]